MRWEDYIACDCVQRLNANSCYIYKKIILLQNLMIHRLYHMTVPSGQLILLSPLGQPKSPLE